MRNAFIGEILSASALRDDIFVISGDAGLGVFDEFKVEHPDRFLNLGVAEQNMISFAAGLALSGTKVYVYNIIPFVLYRCYEQVRNDICYQELPVTLVGIGSGLTYSPQGMTHYSIEDVALAKTLPNLTVYSPCDPVEARAAAMASLVASGPCYIRLAKRGEPDIHEAELDDISGPLTVREGERVAILFHGSIGGEALAAAEKLAANGVNARVVSVPTVQPLAADVLFESLGGFQHVVSVEEHYVTSGLGDTLASEYVSRKPSWELHRLGVPYGFVHAIRDQAGMREDFGISASKIAEFVSALGE